MEGERNGLCRTVAHRFSSATSAEIRLLDYGNSSHPTLIWLVGKCDGRKGGSELPHSKGRRPIALRVAKGRVWPTS